MRRNGRKHAAPRLAPETERNVMGQRVGIGPGVGRIEGGRRGSILSPSVCPPGYIRLTKLEAFVASKGFSVTVCAKGECPLLPNGNLHMSDVLSLTVTVGDKTFNDDDPALAYSKATGQTAHFLILCKSHVPVYGTPGVGGGAPSGRGLGGVYGAPGSEEIGLGAPNNLPTWPPCSNGEVRDFQGACVPPGAIYPSCMPTTASPRSQTTVHVAVRKGAAPLPDVTYAPGAFLPHHAWQAKLVDLGGGIKGWAAVVAAGHVVHVYSPTLGSLYIQPGGHLNPYVSLLCGYSLPGGGGSGVYGAPGVGCPSDVQVQGNCPDGQYFCTHDNVCKRRSSSEAFG